MLMFKALSRKSIFNLWTGQVFSAIGDEIYKVAFVWLSVEMIGSNTGYLASLQLIALLLFGIFGGKWSDRWNPYKTMINIDLLRAFITLIPVFFFLLDRPSFPALVLSSILIAGLSAFFEPAIQTSLPLLCKDQALLKGANGLLSTTIRLARVTGPAIIGLLSTFIATIHFFSLNALSFLISALSIFSIRKSFPLHVTAPEQNEHILKNFIDSWEVLKKNRELYEVVIAKTITGGAWGLTYGLGIALMIHEMNPKDVTSFGLVMSAYGAGNVISALIVGNMQRKNPALLVYLGLAWLGIGFIGMVISHSFPLILFFAAFTAVGGPLNDLPCTDMIQSDIPLKDMPKIFRLKMTLDTLAAFIFMLASPLLFQFFEVRTVILACGVLTVYIGIYYYMKHHSRQKTIGKIF
jgi:DHA3 family macrolide efflux protein-like MFS transporter